MVAAAIRRVRWREHIFGLAGPLLRRGGDEWTAGAPIVLYHRVTPPGTRVRDPFAVTVDAFTWQMSYLAERYTLVTVKELARRLSAGNGRGLAAVTFDDGYECTVTHALPVLRARHIRATVFVDTGRLNGPSPAPREDHIRALAEAGVEIGSHSVSHADLTRLEGDHLRQELTDSRERLSAITGSEVHGFAHPFGRYSDRTTRAVRNAGYAYACTCRQDRVNAPGDGPYQLTRLEINATDGRRRFDAKLQGRYAVLYAAWYRLGPSDRAGMDARR
jgi:peptidoglycan/xylan/chitin deacetylase (PgdA/CDA1 family)